MVVDVGGGTCDVTLLQSFEGILEVTAYDGDDSLGGIDIDFAIIRWWIEHGMLPAGLFSSGRRYPRLTQTVQLFLPWRPGSPAKPLIVLLLPCGLSGDLHQW